MSTIAEIKELERQSIMLSYASNMLNMTSLLCGLLVVAMVMTLNWIDKRLMDRLSLRLALAISATDALRAGTILVNKIFKINGPLCTIIAGLIPWLTLVYIFLVVSIAFNLHVTILREQPRSSDWEKYYWAGSFVSSTVIVLIPMVAGRLGHDKEYNHCTYLNSSSSETYSWKIGSLVAWIMMGCIYCFTIVVLVLVKMQRGKLPIEKMVYQTAGQMPQMGLDRELQATNEIRVKLKRLIRSVVLYCIVPILTQIGFCMVTIHSYNTGKNSAFYMFWSVIGLGLPGTLNFLVFLTDPSLSAAIRSLTKKRFLRGYRNKTVTPLYLRTSVNDVLMNHKSLFPKSSHSLANLFGQLENKEESLNPQPLKNCVPPPNKIPYLVGNKSKANILDSPSLSSPMQPSLPNPVQPRPVLSLKNSVSGSSVPIQVDPEEIILESSKSVRTQYNRTQASIQPDNNTDKRSTHASQLQYASSLDIINDGLDYSLSEIFSQPESRAIQPSIQFPPPPSISSYPSLLFENSNYQITANQTQFTANQTQIISMETPPAFVKDPLPAPPEPKSQRQTKAGILSTIYSAFPQLASNRFSNRGSDRLSALIANNLGTHQMSQHNIPSYYRELETSPLSQYQTQMSRQTEYNALEDTSVPEFYEFLFKDL